MSDHPDSILKTSLYQLHTELDAKITPFAGYAMPVQYPGGIIKEHQHTRAKAGLFDVSHMGQIKVSGPHAAKALESLVPVDVVGLDPGCQRYALFTNEAGGILDDLMITNAGDHYFVVVNAACKNQDLVHLVNNIGDQCDIKMLNGRSLVALQGPTAATVMESLKADVSSLVFMTGAGLTVNDIDCFVTRSGYTGEDGFEISVADENVESLARALLQHSDVLPVGLGARDSLRLEAGLCLYGHDIDEKITPVEAALSWSISKSRRRDGERPGGFPGAEIILEQLNDGVSKRRVGIRPDGRAPVREGAELQDDNGDTVGHVTSGGFGPSVGAPVAMGYVDTGYKTPGTPLNAIVRGKPLPVTVVKPPFVRHNYYRG